jgi:hypothetical protein
MPPKKRVTTQKIEKKTIRHIDTSDSDTEVVPEVVTEVVSEVVPEVVPEVVTTVGTKKCEKQYIVSMPSVSVKYNQNDNDRVQLAQAINNLTVKGEQFIEAFASFSKFKETIAQLDIQIDTKKKEYKNLVEQIEKEYNDKMYLLDKNLKDKYNCLEREYTDKQKQLSVSYTDMNKDLQNEHKNKQIEATQKLREFKLKGCQDIAKEFDMSMLKNEDYKNMTDTHTKTQRELDELKKKFDTNCNSMRTEEKTKYDIELKRQKLEQELTYKTQTAEMKAQLDQQKREIDMLNKTIDSLKGEISEQRQLTIEIANASSKAQITQNFKKDS